MKDIDRVPYSEVIAFVSVMTRTPPGMLQVSVRPHERGWAAHVGRPNLDMQVGLGPNPESAVTALLRTVINDARLQKKALEALLNGAEKPELDE